MENIAEKKIKMFHYMHKNHCKPLSSKCYWIDAVNRREEMKILALSL